MREIELLSPAKNLECGIAAIQHGADAVYIGATRFGARSAAGNSIDDIKKLTDFAHQYLAKVYVTVNTILFDDELSSTEDLIKKLYNVGVDAILVQDMGILKMDLPPIALHASTQTDNRTADKVKWLGQQGFKRVVLARELSVEEMKGIHKKVPDMPLEVFVHGALCVSYSGLCYASQYCFGRSANRGKCAQFCRLKFNLEDSTGNVIERDSHLLSLKDMAQIDNLEELIEAGATSFKIEGRLKDVDYVKNVTAAYSDRLNEIIKRNPDKYRRSSVGHCTYTFTPNLHKTFNRGYTTYFLHGRQPDIASFDTPKAMGEYVGCVKGIYGHSFTVAGISTFTNGDGLCFINKNKNLEGFRVNRVENNMLYPLKMPLDLEKGTRLYRNNDEDFKRLLAKPSAERKINVDMCLKMSADGFTLVISDETGRNVSAFKAIDVQEAVKPQHENITRVLGKLGNTPYRLANLTFSPAEFPFFIPAAQLTDLRRICIDKLSDIHPDKTEDDDISSAENTNKVKIPSYKYSYLYNCSNKLSRQFYAEQDMSDIDKAFELSKPTEPLIMQCRHCLRYSLGYCEHNGGKHPVWQEPLYLVLPDGKKFRLQFDCKNCKMNIYGEVVK